MKELLASAFALAQAFYNACINDPGVIRTFADRDICMSVLCHDGTRKLLRGVEDVVSGLTECKPTHVVVQSLSAVPIGQDTYLATALGSKWFSCGSYTEFSAAFSYCITEGTTITLLGVIDQCTKVIENEQKEEEPVKVEEPVVEPEEKKETKKPVAATNDVKSKKEQPEPEEETPKPTNVNTKAPEAQEVKPTSEEPVQEKEQPKKQKQWFSRCFVKVSCDDGKVPKIEESLAAIEKLLGYPVLGKSRMFGSMGNLFTCDCKSKDDVQMLIRADRIKVNDKSTLVVSEYKAPRYYPRQ